MNTLTVLVIILIVFSVWNLKSSYDLKKFNKSKVDLKDDKYFELKYKIEFITSIAIVVISVGGFFGYKASDEINKRANNLKNRLDALDSLIIAKKDTLYNYDTKTKNLNDSLIRISDRIRVINSKNIVKQDFYIADNLKFCN
jgi:heme/copper-type cytochrome/quinol oxidase subunit 2